jgi:hypothetical protein
LAGVSAQLAGLRRLLDREAGLLVRRLRGFTEARYAAEAPPFASRAAVARHLAQALASTAQDIESAGSNEEPSGRRLPALPPLALADAVAVTANDLVAALEPTLTMSVAVDAVAAGALAEVLLHRRDLDGSPPGWESAAAALEVLTPGAVASPRLLLIEAQHRCPAYGPWRSS